MYVGRVIWEASSGNLESWEPSLHSLLKQGNQENPLSKWPVAGPSEYWFLASSPASKGCPKHIEALSFNKVKVTVKCIKLVRAAKLPSLIEIHWMVAKLKRIYRKQTDSFYFLIGALNGIFSVIISELTWNLFCWLKSFWIRLCLG
jgi:hypothetical protein